MARRAAGSAPPPAAETSPPPAGPALLHSPGAEPACGGSRLAPQAPPPRPRGPAPSAPPLGGAPAARRASPAARDAPPAVFRPARVAARARSLRAGCARQARSPLQVAIPQPLSPCLRNTVCCASAACPGTLPGGARTTTEGDKGGSSIGRSGGREKPRSR